MLLHYCLACRYYNGKSGQKANLFLLYTIFTIASFTNLYTKTLDAGQNYVV